MSPQQPDQYKYLRIESGELIDALTRGCLALERGQDAEGVIHELNRAAHSLKGAARLVELFDVGNAAHSLEDEFSLLLQHSATPTTDEVTDLLKQVDELQQMVAGALSGGDDECVLTEKPDAVHSANAPSPSTLQETRSVARDPQATNSSVATEQLARVPTVTLDAIGRCAGEALELGSRIDGWREKIHLARRSVRTAAVTLDEYQQAAERAVATRCGNTTKIGAAQSRSFGSVDTADLRSQFDEVLQEIESGFEIIEPLARRLHRLSLETKLVSVAEFAHRFEKTIRDTAMESACEADLELTGARIQVDRRVLQILTEPICHLLRNSVAHGIEAPSKRKELGKPSKGAIGLLFEKSPDMIRVIVEDDGAGLDVDAIRNAAGVDGVRPAEKRRRRYFRVHLPPGHYHQDKCFDVVRKRCGARRRPRRGSSITRYGQSRVECRARLSFRDRSAFASRRDGCFCVARWRSGSARPPGALGPNHGNHTRVSNQPSGRGSGYRR